MLVTGAAGFVGANLVRRLLDEGHIVHAVARPGSDAWRLSDVLSDVVLHDANLTDLAATAAVVREAAPEWVFHPAAYGAYPAQRDPESDGTHQR